MEEPLNRFAQIARDSTPVPPLTSSERNQRYRQGKVMVCISCDDAEALDALSAKYGYTSRAHAIRGLLSNVP